ncbi:GDSL esterase/lipase At5g62930-like isoform X2 [Coffea arabica]|uniref:GDSL esterase/lipase At5g62930-like isoform X2 n=1 Tax=Coffea arabica TaxID=13443 RepID=A0ABM4U4F7_COFAR
MRPQIVLFGDSITEQSFRSGGWGAALADTYSRKADIVNRGFGGYNTRWALFLLHHLFPLRLLLLQPYFLEQMMQRFWEELVQGSMCQLMNTRRIFGEWFNILRLLQECCSTMLIVLITPPPVDEEGRKEYARALYGEKAMKLPERTNETAGLYAEKCVELARELDLPSINLWSKMQEMDGWQKKFLRDGLHLTEDGNAVVYQEVVRVFSETWLPASKMPYDFPHHSEIDPENPGKAFQQQCLGV